MKGFTRNFRPLNVLTEEQVEAIHRGTLNVLEKTGMRFEHQKALKLCPDSPITFPRANFRFFFRFRIKNTRINKHKTIWMPSIATLQYCGI